MDITNFLDPMGGSGREPIVNGTFGMLGFLFEPAYGAFSGHLMKKEGRAAGILLSNYKSQLKEFSNLQGPRLPEIMSSKLYSEQLSKGLKAKASSMAKTKKFIGKVGWAFTASWLFDIGQELATPGISKAAEKSNTGVIMNESPLDSGRAFTQRQRAMQAIYDSQMTVGRSMIGQEASFLHS